jgi:phosphoribosylanthranilate isomerase
MQRTRIKICGIRSHEHVRACTAAGADAIGFVFYPPSARHITAVEAAPLIAAMPAFITSVGLFVNPEPQFVRDVIAQTRLDLLQFHGDEDAHFCAQFGRPYIKAIRVGRQTDLLKYAEPFANARGLLLDAEVTGQFGGTGHSFDWSIIPADLGPSITLSGGLTVETVADAIAKVRPYAVDVSSGVESSKGVKSSDLIHQFCQAVTR